MKTKLLRKLRRKYSWTYQGDYLRVVHNSNGYVWSEHFHHHKDNVNTLANACYWISFFSGRIYSPYIVNKLMKLINKRTRYGRRTR